MGIGGYFPKRKSILSKGQHNCIFEILSVKTNCAQLKNKIATALAMSSSLEAPCHLLVRDLLDFVLDQLAD